MNQSNLAMLESNVGQGAPGADQAAQADAKNDDDVVDAEYTEVKDDKK